MTDSDVNRIIEELKSLQISHTELTRKVNQVHQGLYGIPSTSDKGFCGRLESVEITLKRVIVIISVAAGSGGLGALIAKVSGG